MRLVFVNRFYWPETPASGQLLTDLAEALARTGREVTVITSHSGAPGVTADERRNGVHIQRLRSARQSRAGLLGKARDWIAFYLRAMVRLSKVTRRDATVIAMTDPPLLGIGAWLVARWRGAQMIHWVQDIYPELAIELAGQPWLRMVRPLRNLAWRRADACVTLGADMAGLLEAAKVADRKRAIIPNWAPAGLSPQPRSASEALRAAWGLSGKFVVAYSGNLGRVHDLEPVLDVAAALRAESAVAFVFIGDGAQREALQADASRRGLANVSFQPPQARGELARSLAVADLHLVTLRPGCERLVFPSKLYGIAAVGRPLLFIGPIACEVAKIVRQHGFGDAADRNDVGGIANCILRLQRDDAEWMRRAAAATRFAAANDFTAAASRWRSLLEAMHACSQGPMAATTLDAP